MYFILFTNAKESGEFCLQSNRYRESKYQYNTISVTVWNYGLILIVNHFFHSFASPQSNYWRLLSRFLKLSHLISVAMVPSFLYKKHSDFPKIISYATFFFVNTIPLHLQLLSEELISFTSDRRTRVSSVWPSTPTRDSPCTPSVAPSCTEASVDRKCHPTSSPFLTVLTSTCWPTTRINLCWLRKLFNISCKHFSSSIPILSTGMGLL